jgi:hypothetical protein
MSFLVELPRETFPDDALDGLDVGVTKFRLENAQAMMWMSQLAYETAHEGKVNDILKAWKLTRLAFGSNDPVTGLPPKSACFVVAEGHGATIVTFSGTDPLKIEDWIKDFTVQLEPNVLHAGFDMAVEAVWPTVEAAIKGRTEQPLFFTGHSMGAALAIIAAEHALKANILPTLVYTFGCPRAGGLDFFNRYTLKLGDRTFRLVHGHDIVPTVPPSLNGNFRHVGQLLHCRSGGQFAGLTPAPSDQNEPDFFESPLSAVVDAIKIAAAGDLFRSVAPGLLGHSTLLLPPTVRDHIPASYFQALSIPLE